MSADSPPVPETQTVTPYFTVKDADRLVDFVMAAFDGKIVRISRDDGNRIQHARMLVGTTLIMLNESTDNYPANVSQMHVYVANADAAYRTAIELGSSPLMEPNDRPHGDRMAGIIDPCGNIWWLASQRL